MKYLFLAVALACAGCAHQQPSVPAYSTMSGKPEVVFKTDDMAKARSALTNDMLSDGWVISGETASQIVFDKQIENFGAMMMYGSNFNRVPNARVVFSMAHVDGGIRVVATPSMVTNPGSGFEQSSAFDQETLNVLYIRMQYASAVFEPTPENAIPSEPLSATPDIPDAPPLGH